MIQGAEWWSFIGGVLEIGGLGLVTVGIDRRLRSAGRPGLWSTLGTLIWTRVRALLVRLKLMKPKVHSVHVGAAVSMSGGGSMRASGSASVEGTLEEKVAVLFRKVEALGSRVEVLDKGLRVEKEERERALAKERAEREAAVANLESELRDVAAGDFKLEAMGVALFLLGVISQTIGGIA